MRERVRQMMTRVLGRQTLARPDQSPPGGTESSATPDRLESPSEDRIEAWDDEWEAPVIDEPAWTPPEVPHAETLRKDPARFKNWLGFFAVFFGCCLLYLPFIGDFGLWDPWETHYGEVSRHMTETNDYISPWWGAHWKTPSGAWEGKGFFSKPILVLWSMAFGLDGFGWTEFGIRIGVALMAIFGVCMVYMSATSIWSRRTGFIAAGVIATSPFYFFLARQTQTDMPFVAMLLCAMCFFLMGAFGRDRRKPADRVHYGLFIGALLVLVVPQLFLIGADTGFNEEQRAMRPGLRAQSMHTFKAEAAMQQVVSVQTPHLSPNERDALAQLPPEQHDAEIEAAKGTFGDLQLELIPPFLAVLLAIGAIAGIVALRLRRRLDARLLRGPTSGATAWWLLLIALGCQILAFGLHAKRLYDAWGFNWESEFPTSFNLVKFSGLAMTLLLMALTAYALLQTRKRTHHGLDTQRATFRITVLAFAVLLILLVSPALLVIKSKALGLNGTTFWDEVLQYGSSDIARIVLRSVYAPLLIGLFLGGWAFTFLARGASWWKERDASLFAPAFIALSSIIFMCVSVFYIPVTFENKLTTFGKVASQVLSAVFQWGPVQIGFYLLCVALALWSLYLSKRKTAGQMYFMGFYIFAALATMAKGLLGFLLPGAVIFVYLICTVEWKRLLEFEVPRGILVFIAVGVPWYAAMLILHGDAYWTRFFIHDHFKRLGSGVHQIDSGTFEHFIKWLGYGLFPWVALIPAAIMRLGAGRGLLLRDDRSRATLMLAIWATFAFTLFSLSSTKFHHYIFPAIPPLAFLVALLLSDLSLGKLKRFAPLAVVACALLALITADLYQDPQHWKNLFTYKYDRGWIDRVPEFDVMLFGEPTTVRGTELHLQFKHMALIIGAISGLGLIFFFFRHKWIRTVGLVVLLGSGAALTVWGLNVYMPSISPTWSQRGLWMSYWNTCTRTNAPPNADPKKIWCEESSVVYRITWRGEHYYSQNESVPVQNNDDFKHFIEENGETPFYIMTDRARYCLGSEKTPNFFDECKGNGSIVSEVKKFYPGKPVDHELAWGANLKFVLVKFYPAGRPKDARPTEDVAREALYGDGNYWIKAFAEQYLIQPEPPPKKSTSASLLR